MSRTTQIADLLRQAGNASTLSEQREFVRQAEQLKSEQHTASLGSGEWSEEDAVIRDTLVPGFTHELHTAATDWLIDLDDVPDERQAHQSMIAEASLWYERVNDDVKSYGDEYNEQAKNLAHRLAGQYGDFADQAERAFTDEATRLRTTAVRAGIIVEAGADDIPEENKGPKQKKYESQIEDRIEENRDGQVSPVKTSSYEDEATDEQDKKDDADADNPFGHSAAHQYQARRQGGDDLFAVLAASEGNEVTGNPGVYPNDAEATSSNRAPVLQELQSNSQDVVPVNDPGLGKTDDQTGANATRTGEEDHATGRSFPVHSHMNKESNMGYVASCPTCGGHGKVAVRSQPLPSILDITKESVSGLDQIDQTVDPHDNGPKPTPYPDDVAFPWLMNGPADIAAATQQTEEQIAQRNSLSPLQQGRSQQGSGRQQSVQSAYTAGGRDNSGWIGDAGARGLDYPGEQIGQYPAPSTTDGYVDPAHGNGGDHPNQPVKPYGAAEEQDYTNNQGQNWQPGQPTQADQGWRETVQQNPALASAAAFLEQHRLAYLKSGR